MKKIAAILASLCLLLLTACGTSSTSSIMPESSMIGNESGAGAGGGDMTSSGTSSTPTGSIRVGLGIVATTEESQPANAEQSGRAHFNVAVCALALGEGDTIASIRFDTVQSQLGFDLTGAFLGDITALVQTKRELGDAYGLKAASGIGKGWYEQVDALERWMVGKTVDEVLGMKVTERDATHTHVPNIEELKSSVTISVTDQLRALEKAYANVK